METFTRLMNSDEERMITAMYYVRKKRRERARQSAQTQVEEDTIALSGDEA